MRAAGQTALPAPTLLDSAEDLTVPSREPGRSIPVRVFRPQNGKPVKALFLHIHGGGWVLQDHKSQDPTLQSIADATGVVAVSVGYRLAPEHPFPAGPEDCYDAAEWLVDNAESKFGVPFAFVGGESAGGHLSVLVALHLLQSPNPRYAKFSLKGLLLHYGCYDLTWTPRVRTFVKTPTLLLDKDLMDHFADAFLPNMTFEQRRDPSVSPLYADFESLRGRLPPALFTCGTEDCLLDDTIFLSAKWLIAGGETVLTIVPGAPHGYTMFPRNLKGTGADVGLDGVEKFIASKIGA